MSSNKVDIHDKATAPRDDRWERQVIDALRAIRYGSVEMVVHDGRVVQIESRVKVRFDGTDRPTGRPGGVSNQDSLAHRAIGGLRQPHSGEEEKNR